VKWNIWRLKTQWKFLVSRERSTIKFFVPLGLLLVAGSPVLAFFVQTSHPKFFGTFCFLMLFAGLGLLMTSWATFIDHLSPNLLTHEDLTEGTE
jgi:protein-S-isoprenylcysteine O-methyltransferase Ste14